ncbi:MAG: hypothetical protein AVDCRST_MAG55-3323, partial [uncultured Rubrobacteraceae bacterium]
CSRSEGCTTVAGTYTVLTRVLGRAASRHPEIGRSFCCSPDRAGLSTVTTTS